jgi:hydrogenase maturation factor HypF (carbamoyltransferase family)
VVKRFCEVSPAEEELLLSERRPIVLLNRRAESGLPPAVAPEVRTLGFMLPYSPLHHLLLADSDRPLVMTSGNVSDEPICHDDEDARERLNKIADHFLLHDRPIHRRADDSIARVQGGGRASILRRARLRAAPAQARLYRGAPDAGLRRGAEEHFLLHARRPGFSESPHRRSGESGDAAIFPPGRRGFQAALQSSAGGGRLRPAPRIPFDQIRLSP